MAEARRQVGRLLLAAPASRFKLQLPPPSTASLPILGIRGRFRPQGPTAWMVFFDGKARGLTLSNLGPVGERRSWLWRQWLLRWLWGPPHRGSADSGGDRFAGLRPPRRLLSSPTALRQARRPACQGGHSSHPGALARPWTSWDCTAWGLIEGVVDFLEVAAYAHPADRIWKRSRSKSV